MIKKIQNTDYRAKFASMSVKCREEHIAAVKLWLKRNLSNFERLAADSNARFQNVIQFSTMWNDSVCEAWEEAVRLLTPFASPGSWLPDAVYAKSAKRSITWVTKELKGVVRASAKEEVKVRKDSEAANTEVQQEPVREQTVTNEVPEPVKTADNARVRGVVTGVSRPQHIDQYVHLLPKKTQERAAMVKDLKRQEDVARENARLLMKDPNASASSLAHWAGIATKCDDTVRSIYKELDKEWEKLVNTGRVVVDELGIAHVIDTPIEGEREDPASETAEEAEPETSQEVETPQESSRMVSGEAKDALYGKPEGESESTEEPVTKQQKRRGRPAKKDASQIKEEKAAKELEKMRKSIERMTDEQKSKRREYLKKWLRDTRTNKSEQHDKQWVKNLEELKMLGGEVTDSIRRAAGVYGIALSED